MDMTPQQILEHLPDWEGASITELSGGLTNQTWLLARDGHKAVLKIDEKAREAPFNSRPDEARIQGMAATNDLANTVLHSDTQVLLTQYVEGEVWQSENLHNAENLRLLAAALRRLHRLPLTGRSFDAKIAAAGYIAAIDGWDPNLVAHCARLIEDRRLPHNLCCCHNDLIAANVIATPDLMFLDWEYACDNDPFFDLATIVEHHELDEGLALHLLDEYFDGDGERWLPQLRSQQTLYLALCWLWLAARPDSTRDELDRMAARLLD
jgi:thiamine kinase-like enzyme